MYRFLLLIILTGSSVACHSQTNFAILAPDGAWTWYNDPRALFHNGFLYFGYVRNLDGRSVLSSFNPLTGARNELWTASRTEKDDHDVAGLLVKEDGTMLAISARHGTDQFFAYRLSTSTNPVTAADWGAEQTIPATGAGLTYANPYQLSAESGLVYNFSRDLNFNPTVFTSTNGGSTWSAPQLFIKTGTGSIRPYVKYASDYAQRIDFLYTDGHPRDVTNSLYHMYYQGGSLYKTDGAFVKSFTNLPVLHDAGERGSVVYQYSDAPSADPNDHIATGRAWCWETAYQSNGWPVCVFTVQVDNVTGTNWFDDRIYYYYARWTGTNWQKRFIAQAGRPLYTPETDYAGGICLDPNDPDVLYLSSNAARPFDLTDITNVPLNISDRYELWRGSTTDGGLTFTWTAITTNSATDNLRPYIPRHQTGTPVVLWFRGTYTTFTSYSCEVVGLFNNPVPAPPNVTLVRPGWNPASFTNLSNQLRLTVNATDDGRPGPLSILWTTLSGPTNAIFENPASMDTVARFPLPGTYVVRCFADDTAMTNSIDVTVNAGTAATDGADPARTLWLKLDESSGITAADSSGNGNNGTLSGGASWQPAAGAKQGAIRLDGLSGLITVLDNDALDNTPAFTLMYWFKAAAYPGDSAGLVCKRNGINTDNAYTTYLKAADQHIYVDIDGSNNRFASSATVRTGLWYHVALVYDGSLPSAQRAKLWLNGALDTTAAESSAALPNYASNVMLGNTHPGATNWFNGWIDDVRFYRRALTGTEVLALAGTNSGPNITAGPAAPATNRLTSTVMGNIVDDGKAGPVTAAWTQLTGPGTATFSSSNTPFSNLTFDKAGNYVLRLAGADSQLEMSQDLNVTVYPNTNVFEDWIAGYFPGVTNSNIAGIFADPDHDQASNLLEFALGLDPASSDVKPFAPGQPGLPKGSLQLINGTNYLVLVVQRPIGRIGVAYAAEVSNDLFNWSLAVAASGPANNGDGTETIIFRDVVPVPNAVARFIRLKITSF